MTAATTATSTRTPVRHDLTGRTLSARRRITNHLATGGIVLAVLLAVIPLGLVAYTVVVRGGGVMSLDFLTERIPNSYRREGPGMGPAIIGTLLAIAGVAVLFLAPLWTKHV